LFRKIKNICTRVLSQNKLQVRVRVRMIRKRVNLFYAAIKHGYICYIFILKRQHRLYLSNVNCISNMTAATQWKWNEYHNTSTPRSVSSWWCHRVRETSNYSVCTSEVHSIIWINICLNCRDKTNMWE